MLKYIKKTLIWVAVLAEMRAMHVTLAIPKTAEPVRAMD